MTRPDSQRSSAAPPADAETRRAEPSGAESNPADGPAPPLNRWLAWALAILGALPVALIMASDRRLIISVPVGLIGLTLSSVGFLAAFGCFTRQPDDVVESSVSARSLAKPTARWLLSVVVFVFAVRFAVDGAWVAPELMAAVCVTGAFLWSVCELYRLGIALGVYTEAGPSGRPLQQRHGFWLIVLASLLYLPMLGNFGLIDPWETHYGEVAREMLARDDWLSLWWAHDGWFWSKPILNFWLQGLAFKLFGVSYMPDAMIHGIAEGNWPQPEWACRLPIFLLTVIGGYVLYKGVAVAFGRRVSFIGSLILLTCPYWYLLARQTMADMPYAAPLTAAMGFLLLAFHTPSEQRARSYEIRFGRRRFYLNAHHLLFGAILLCVLPQVLYLLTRNVTFHTRPELFGFALHPDEFMQGSGGGNCGLPGNRGCATRAPLIRWAQPAASGGLWLLLTLGLMFFKRRERRTQRLYFLAAWLCTAIAVMAKGAPGLVIPLAAALVFIVITGRLRLLRQLELAGFFALMLVVALPWYVQMFFRHGRPFIDRLILHDMFKRAFVHVHDTNKGDDTSFRYYIWQLGYGLFPWTGLAATGLIWLGRSETDRDDPKTTTLWFLFIWWLLAFGMFTITLTKFHHYIFPLVPPTAMLAGVALAQYLPRALPAQRGRWLSYLALLAAGTTACVAGIVAWVPGSWNGHVPAQEAPSQPLLGISLLALGAALLGAAIRRSAGAPAGIPESERRLARPMLSALALTAGVLVLLAGRDLFTSFDGDVPGGARLLHLFTYNYARTWPAGIDFTAPLAAFAAVATIACLGMAAVRWHQHFALMLCFVGVLFSAWCVNTYLVELSPHWGQRETIAAYYQQRQSAQEPLVAYQMNWKGENFYTGNRMATFVSSGKKFKRWIEQQRERGKQTFYFTTEHTRLSRLKRELGEPEQFEVLTTKELNNKFALARAVFPPLEADTKTPPDSSADDDEPEDPRNRPGSGE